MNRVPEIHPTKWNHGNPPALVMTCEVPIEVSFESDDIVRLLNSCDSSSMAKIVNAMGRAFNQSELAECYAADDLDDDGRQFVDSMYYFLHAKDGEA